MIVVTAPTSNIGQQVLANILDTSEPIRVIARDPSHLPAHTRECVEVAQGSHSDLDVISRAFTGADAVFWLVPPSTVAQSLEAAYLDFTRSACEAIKSQGVQRVVGISALGRGTPVARNAGLVTASLAMDDQIASTGVSYRALTMPSFMDNVLRQVEPIKSRGVFFSPIDGDRKLPACATRDIAAVAARLLLEASWSGVGQAAVLGPEDLSFNDMAAIISDVLRKSVRFQQVSFEAFKASFIERGAAKAFAQGMTDMMRAKNEGLDNAEPQIPPTTKYSSSVSKRSAGPNEMAARSGCMLL